MRRDETMNMDQRTIGGLHWGDFELARRQCEETCYMLMAYVQGCDEHRWKVIIVKAHSRQILGGSPRLSLSQYPQGLCGQIMSLFKSEACSIFKDSRWLQPLSDPPTGRPLCRESDLKALAASLSELFRADPRALF